LQRDPKSLLWDARGAAEVITAVTMGKSFADFDRDIILRSAVERQFEIIGEALAQLARIDADGAESARSAADHRLSQRLDPRLCHSRSCPRLALIEDNLPPLRGAR
jgi:hypothetical protein